MKKFFNFIFFSFFVFYGCTFFESPKGNSEIISVHTRNYAETHYLSITIRLSNVGNKNIYNSTISVQADSTKKTYYKTATSNTIINPNNEIYFIIELNFTDDKETNIDDNTKEDENKEIWKEDSVKIINAFWN